MKWPQGASGVVFAKRHFIIPKAANLEDISDAVAAEMFGSMELPGMSLGDVEGGLVGYDELVASGGTDVFGDPIDGSSFGAMGDFDDDDEDELFEGFFQAVGKGVKAVGKGIGTVAKGVGKGVKTVAVGSQGHGGVAGATKFALTGKEWGDKKGGVLGAAKTVATGKEWGDEKGGIGGALKATGRGVKKVAAGSEERRIKRQDRRAGRRERRQDRVSDTPMIASYREKRRDKRQDRRDERSDRREADITHGERLAIARANRQAEGMDPGYDSIVFQSAADAIASQVRKADAITSAHINTPENVRGWLRQINQKLASGRIPEASQLAEELIHAIQSHDKHHTDWGYQTIERLWPLIRA